MFSNRAALCFSLLVFFTIILLIQAKNMLLEITLLLFRIRNGGVSGLGHPLGIGYSAKTTHSALLAIPPKVCKGIQFLDADFGNGNAQQREYSASKSA